MNDLAAPPHQPTQPFASRSEHQAAIAILLRTAQRELRIFDQNCAELGLNSPERFEGLRQFLLGNRAHRLLIVVHQTSYLAARCPRMILLMRQFSHAVFVQKTRKELHSLHDNFIVADDSTYVKQFHYEHPRGVLGIDNPVETQALLMRFGEIWENSTPGLAATTLGL
jgi:hypothetical protein